MLNFNTIKALIYIDHVLIRPMNRRFGVLLVKKYSPDFFLKMVTQKNLPVVLAFEK